MFLILNLNQILIILRFIFVFFCLLLLFNFRFGALQQMDFVLMQSSKTWWSYVIHQIDNCEDLIKCFYFSDSIVCFIVCIV
jgi:hypothetical protein